MGKSFAEYLCWFVGEGAGEFDRGNNVFAGNPRILAWDLINSITGGNKVENVRNSYTCAADAWFAGTDSGINNDFVHR